MSKPATGGRETILARIREASTLADARPASAMPAHAYDGLPRAFTSPDERIGAFARNMEELHCSFVLCDSPEDVREGVATLAARSGWKSIAAHRSSLISEITPALKDLMQWTDQGLGKNALASCDAGIVLADALDAQTGGILISGKKGALEIAACTPALVVIATRLRLAGDLHEAFSMIKAANGNMFPPGLAILTGGPVTDAVERLPVPKGHGPRNIIVFLTLSET